MRNSMKLLIILSILSFSLSSSALTIVNENTKDIMVEIVDCPTVNWYGYPTAWRERCTTFAGSGGLVTCTTSNSLSSHIEFLHLSKIKPNTTLAFDKNTNPDLPDRVCLNIAGASGSIQKKEVKNSCEMTIHDNGFLWGITAEYLNDCD